MKVRHLKRRLTSWCMRRAISSWLLGEQIRRFGKLTARHKKLIHYRDYWK